MSQEDIAEELVKQRSEITELRAQLEQQIAIRAVNTKWMMLVAGLVLAALGYTNFVQIPREADTAAKNKIGPKVVEEANNLVTLLRTYESQARDAKLIERGDGFLRIGDLQVCWGAAPTQSNHSENLAVKSGTFNFPHPFAMPPTISHTARPHKGCSEHGDAYVLYSGKITPQFWSYDLVQRSGRPANEECHVEVNYIAIGRAKL